ncbi:MAG TPA: GNAT family N-acetyltransferase [Sedimentibacter sp.]|jgi:ribosomal protein S18 acetylase RimI-like enzyme|nr:GNAT family N-acetyltransferase [Sedimentibacter sp.]NLA13463.1 GNAT family N-acetyltransferase [Tissierellia bacterium]HOA19040.1 GNAT family N-acetyltransferase [Sedimentibacter sp.]HOG62002.1 GNAT family N-acetyltransferase [Sedimentibacter sp.]HOT21747.1 GNAT family N-acetyltransferase [Sedimentibacter sp.]
MDNLERIAQFEKFSPMLYLDYKLTSWGRMLCDIGNKESYTSNYAVIYRNENVDNIIKEVEEYYNSRSIIPKIFNRCGSVELDILRPFFTKHDYAIREFDMDLMILDTHSTRNKIAEKVEVKIINRALEGQEYNLAIEQDNGETYGVKLLNKQIASGNNMFFAYNELKKPVSMALAEKYNDVVYITDVYTTPSQRCNGYGTAVVYAVLSHYHNSLIYLHTDNPDAASIYRRLGFSGKRLKSWWAVKGSLPEWCLE